MTNATRVIPGILSLIFASLVASGPASGQAVVQEPGIVARFRALREEGVSAAKAGDLATARARLAAADQLVPNHPSLTLMRARVEAASGDPDAALRLWDRYARFGLVANPSADPTIAGLVRTPAFDPIARRLAVNRQPVGQLETRGLIDQPVIAENVVWDEARSRLLVSTIAGRTILQMDEAGVVSPYLRPDRPVAGILGMALDIERGLLWATASGLGFAGDLEPGMAGRSELLKIELATGRVLARIQGSNATPRSFGDVAVGPDGSAYVSDSWAGDVFRLPPSGSVLETLAPAGVFGSPQGIVAAPDGLSLVVADYSSGLHTIDLSTLAVRAIRGPDDESLLGIDALLQDGHDLIAVQNGVNPERVLRLRVSSDGLRVERVIVLAANLPELDGAAGGSMSEGSLILVSRGQMASFTETGDLVAGPPPPVIISRLVPTAP